MVELSDPVQILDSLGAIGKWLQAIGIVIVIWIVFHISSFFVNRKKLKKIEIIEESLKRIEEKIDRASLRK